MFAALPQRAMIPLFEYIIVHAISLQKPSEVLSESRIGSESDLFTPGG
jgi:hypothetical protein